MNKILLISIIVVVIIIGVVSYLLLSPAKISYSSPMIEGTKIISKAKCSHLFKCGNIQDKVLFELIENTKSTSNNLTSISYKVYESFDLTSIENKKLINDAIKNINIIVDNINNILFDNDKIIINNNKNCSIDGALTTEPCDNNKIIAYYNLTPSLGNGETCTALFDRIRNTLDSNYSNWTYDERSNKITGERSCQVNNNRNCAINGQLVEGSCTNNKIIGHYELTPSIGNGETCSALFNRIRNTLDSNYSNWSYDSQQNKFVGEKDCAVGTNCNITGQMFEINCDEVSEKKKAFYNVNSPTLGGRTCENFVSQVMTTQQKGEYQNWRYDQQTNKIIGEKDCCPSGSTYYNGNCINPTSCPTSLFSESQNICFDECPEGLFYEDVEYGFCKPYVDALTQYQQLLSSINNDDLLCNVLKYSPISDEVFKEYANKNTECGQATKNERFVQLYCNDQGRCNSYYDLNNNISYSGTFIYPSYISNDGKEIDFYLKNLANDRTAANFIVKYNDIFNNSIVYKINGGLSSTLFSTPEPVNISFVGIKFLNNYIINNNEVLILYKVMYSQLVNNNWTFYNKLFLIKYTISENKIDILNNNVYKHLNNIFDNCDIYYRNNNSIVNMYIKYYNNNEVIILKNNNGNFSSFTDISNTINGNLLDVLLPSSSNYIHLFIMNGSNLYSKYSADGGQTYNETLIYTYPSGSSIPSNPIMISCSSKDSQHIFLNCTIPGNPSKEYFVSHDYGSRYERKQINTISIFFGNTQNNFHDIYNITCSEDGKYVTIFTILDHVILTANRQVIKIYISSDYGFTFQESTSIKLDFMKYFLSSYEKSLNCSANGKYQVFSFYDYNNSSRSIIFYSENYGQTWVIKEMFYNDIPNRKENDFFNKLYQINLF